MTEFARILSTLLGRAVIDKTGFAGTFDADVVFAADQATRPVQDLVAQGLASDDPNAVTIFTALQDQLGLRLSSGKGPSEVLILDSVERPSDN